MRPPEKEKHHSFAYKKKSEGFPKSLSELQNDPQIIMYIQYN